MFEEDSLFTPMESSRSTEVSGSQFFINFLNQLEGWKTKCKNLHWAAPKKNIHVYLDRHEVKVHNQLVELTKKEYDLLLYLLHNHDHVLSREQILQSIWGYEYMGDTNVVDVYIRYLRAKIDDYFNEKYIHTVRGIGYVIKT